MSLAERISPACGEDRERAGTPVELEPTAAVDAPEPDAGESPPHMDNPPENCLRFDLSDSHKNVSVDPNQVVFKTSSIAILRAKGKMPGGDSLDGSDESPNGRSFEANASSVLGQNYLSGARRVLQYMHALRTRHMLCDVLFKVAGGDIYAHKIALGAYSEALAKKFAEYPPGEILSIDLTDFVGDVVRAVVDFVYTTDLDLSDQTVGPILLCATEIGMGVIIQSCMAYLSGFNEENAILYYSIADQCGIADRRVQIFNFICVHFSEISKTRHYLFIPLDRMLGLLSADNLSVDSELDIFYAAVRWIDYRRNERLPSAAVLLRCVRFQLIEPEVICTRVESVDWLFQPRDCFKVIYEALRFHSLRLTQSQLVHGYPKQRHRKNVSGSVPTPGGGLNDTFFSTDGGSPKDSRSPGDAWNRTAQQNTTTPGLGIIRTRTPNAPGESNSPREQSRVGVPPLQQLDTPVKVLPSDPATPTRDPLVRSLFGSPEQALAYSTPRQFANPPPVLATPAPGLVPVVVGGMDLQNTDPDIPGRYIHKFDVRTNQWHVLTTLRDYTHHHGVVVLHGKLFVLGGAVYDHRFPKQLGSATDKVWIFDPRTRIWTLGASMKHKRAYHGVATWGGNIYVVGGEDERKRKLNSVECYNSSTGKWSVISSMPGGPKIGMSVAVLGNYLYIVGGYNKDRDGGPVMAHVECYNLERQRWIKRKRLEIPRCHANLVNVNGSLLLIGGRTMLDANSTDSIMSLASVEEYDEQTDSWCHVAEMRIPRHDSGCAVVDSRVFIVGGMQHPSAQCMTSVECLDTDIFTWFDDVNPMTYATSGSACAALETV